MAKMIMSKAEMKRGSCAYLIVHRAGRAHYAVFEPSKTVPTQTLPEFHHRKDQSTILSILVEKLAAAMCCKGALFRPKNTAYFIKGTHIKNHFRASSIDYTCSRLYI